MQQKDRSNLENLTIKIYILWPVKLKDLAHFLFEVIFASTASLVLCANDFFLWMNFCICAVTVYTKKVIFNVHGLALSNTFPSLEIELCKKR